MRTWTCAVVTLAAVVAQVAAVGPLLSDNGWTPVASSRVLPRPPQLPPQVQPQVQSQPEAEDRISVEDVEELLEEAEEEVHTEEPAESNEPLPSQADQELLKTDTAEQEKPQLEAQQEPEQSPQLEQEQEQEPAEIPQREQAQLTNPPLAKPVAASTEPEKAPIIVYPEGAQSSQGPPQDYFQPEQPRPDPFPRFPPGDYQPDFLSGQQQQQQPSAFPPPPPHIYHRERVPLGPPPPPPRPLRPLPGPPPQEQLGDGLARHQESPYDVSGQELSPYPAQPPPPGPPPPGPPRPRPRPGPPAKPGVLASLGSRFSSIGSSIKCAAEDYAADGRLTDKVYMQQQIACLLDDGPCDKDGLAIKRLAPDIMKGLCPGDCDECKKQQIQKMMATFTQKYPYEYSLMLKKFTG